MAEVLLNPCVTCASSVDFCLHDYSDRGGFASFAPQRMIGFVKGKQQRAGGMYTFGMAWRGDFHPLLEDSKLIQTTDGRLHRVHLAGEGQTC